jgi:hypothetical protein
MFTRTREVYLELVAWPPASNSELRQIDGRQRGGRPVVGRVVEVPVGAKFARFVPKRTIPART